MLERNAEAPGHGVTDVGALGGDCTGHGCGAIL